MFYDIKGNNSHCWRTITKHSIIGNNNFYFVFFHCNTWFFIMNIEMPEIVMLYWLSEREHGKQYRNIVEIILALNHKDVDFVANKFSLLTIKSNIHRINFIKHSIPAISLIENNSISLPTFCAKLFIPVPFLHLLFRYYFRVRDFGSL